MAERVLIVDDDPVARRLVEDMVSRAGYEPVTAHGGDLALAMLADGAPIDCVILDLVMPDLDGLGVLAKMRAAGIGIPVIVQTAHGGIDNVSSAMRAGAVDFVVKPVGAERLTVSLRNVLAARALEHELKSVKRSQSVMLDKAAPAGHANLPPGAMLRLVDNGGNVLPLDAIEAAAIRFAIALYRGQMSEVARRLRIGRSTRYRKLDQLGRAAGAGKADVADG